MIRRSMLLLSLSFVAAAAQAAQAEPPRVVEVGAGSFYMVKGVNVRNGNFAVTFTTSNNDNDPSGIPFDRIYNSKSEHQSSYGLGWGTVMYNAISFDTDGRLSIRENGTGAVTHYRLREDSPGQSYVSEAAYRARHLKELDNTTLAVKEELRKKMVKAGEIPDQGPIQPNPPDPVPDRAVFDVDDAFVGDSCREGSQIRREGDRMMRVFGNACPTVSESYTLRGALIGVQSRATRIGASLTVTRDPNSGMITAVTDEKGKVTRFQYDARKRLVSQQDPVGLTDKFEYDNRDNMTAIIYVDDSRQTMTYDAQDRALSVVPRRGPSARFEYLTDPYDPNISITRVTVSDGDSKSVTVFKLLN